MLTRLVHLRSNLLYEAKRICGSMCFRVEADYPNTPKLILASRKGFRLFLVKEAMRLLEETHPQSFEDFLKGIETYGEDLTDTVEGTRDIQVAANRKSAHAKFI